MSFFCEKLLGPGGIPKAPKSSISYESISNSVHGVRETPYVIKVFNGDSVGKFDSCIDAEYI